MSINSAMLAGVSGLAANSSAMAAISDNISNINTIGYKRSQSDFQTIVTGQSGAGLYSAGGVLSSTRSFISQQGLLQRTTSNTDLGINGVGFFVTTERATGLEITDSRLFTRAGSFTVDSEGYLRNASNLYLQGWLVDENGEIVVDPSDLTRLQPINVAATGGTVEPTTRATINANLRASQPLSPDLGVYNPATNSMAMYDPALGTGVRPDFEIQIPISDTQGGRRTLTLSVLRSATPNQWYAELRAVPAGDVDVGAPLANGQIRTGIIAFDAYGQLDAAATTLFDPLNPALSFGASADPAPGAGQYKWATNLGIGAQDILISLDEAVGGLTQFDSPTVVQSVIADGTAFGNLVNVEIDEEGYVSAIFDNGVVRRLAQVAIATFPNPNGLLAVSGNAYRVTNESGTYNLKAAGTGGAGKIAPSTLEASTVDLSMEFTGLITTQRAYSASSKIITTADEMLEELLRVKR